MTYIFQKVSKEGSLTGLRPGAEESRDWFREKALSVSKVDVTRKMKSHANLQSKLTPADLGRMYHFFYDPKHKEKLPYYDRFPLIFPINFDPKGFLGINLHYLPHMYRARLMDALYDIEMNDTLRDTKKLKVNYDLLNSVAKYKYFKPCIKKYLLNHVRSRYLYVPYEEWDVALMMPTERFVKSSKTKVWSESQRIIRSK